MLPSPHPSRGNVTNKAATARGGGVDCIAGEGGATRIVLVSPHINTHTPLPHQTLSHSLVFLVKGYCDSLTSAVELDSPWSTTRAARYIQCSAFSKRERSVKSRSAGQTTLLV